LIILGDKITAFANGQIAYTALNPNGSVVYVQQQLAAYNTIGCEFDNYKIWDLSGVDFSDTTSTPTSQATQATETSSAWVTDFAEPILAAIEDRSPDFQDDFSQASSRWSFETGPIPIGETWILPTVYLP